MKVKVLEIDENGYTCVSNEKEMVLLMQKEADIKLMNDMDLSLQNINLTIVIAGYTKKIDLNGHELKFRNRNSITFASNNSKLVITDSSTKRTGRLTANCESVTDPIMLDVGSYGRYQNCSVTFDGITAMIENGTILRFAAGIAPAVTIRDCEFVCGVLLTGDFQTSVIENVLIKPYGIGNTAKVVENPNTIQKVSDIIVDDDTELVYSKYTSNGFVCAEPESDALLNSFSTYNESEDDDNFIAIRSKVEKPEISVTDTYRYTGGNITASVNGYNPRTMNITGNVKKEVGEHEITVTPKGWWKDRTSDEVKTTWTILKAIPEYQVPTNLQAIKGQTLEEIVLPSNFVWKDPETVLDTLGKTAYKAKYIPNDTQNYEEVNDIDIFIKVKENVEITGIENDQAFEYNGTPQKPLGTLEFNNENITEADIEVIYRDQNNLQITLPGVPTNAGDYEVTFAIPDDNEYYVGSVTYYFSIRRKNLLIKPKDVSVKTDEDFDFETEYIGIVTGEEVIPVEDVEYAIYSEEEYGYIKFPTPIPKEEAIKNPGTYVIAYTNNKDTLFDEKNYYIEIETGTLTVTKKSSSNGGSNSSTTYVINAIENENAVIEPSGKVKVKRGENQKFTFKAGDEYEIERVLIDRKNMGAISEYVFKNVKENHTVEVKVKKIEEQKETEENSTTQGHYDDVLKKDWFYETVEEVTIKGLMNGTGVREFSPNIGTTRAMIVTVLYRLEGEPKVSKENTFTDVKDGMWYTDAIAFGEENGIILGYGDGRFGPNDTITREQLVAILHRYVMYKEYKDSDIHNQENLSNFSDIETLSEYASKAMAWAYEQELIKGFDDGTLQPRGNATRAQIATVFVRFCEKYDK